MIPASAITATLSADLTYNPSIHVQTVEIDRTGTSMTPMATNNFVKWYVTLKDFQNLCWNIRDMPHYDAASHSDVSSINTIFAFARSGNHSYGADPYTITTFDNASAEYAEEGSNPGQGSGVVLTQEASGGTVKFTEVPMAISVPLYSDVPGHGEDISAGTQSTVGATTVTFDRVLLDETASGTIAGSNRTEASSTTTTWGFGTSSSAQTSFDMTINWVASQSNSETGYQGDAAHDFSYADGPYGVDYQGMQHWGTNTIHVFPTGVSDITVYKPYNDAAADFIQIGMDASGGSSTFVSGVGSTTAAGGGLGVGTTTYGVAAGDSGAGHNSGNTDPGLVDPLAANSMTAASADDTTDSIDFGTYISDYTATHGDQRRNLINVTIGKPTLKVTQNTFTKALQQAIKDHASTDVLDVSNTQSLRVAVRDAFLAGTLRGFQCGLESVDNQNTHTGAISLDLPLTVAGQVRYADGANLNGQAAVAGQTESAGADHRKVYLTPVIELVSDNYYHPSWYTYAADS